MRLPISLAALAASAALLAAPIAASAQQKNEPQLPNGAAPEAKVI